MFTFKASIKKMNLTIDVGNTLVKYGVFEDGSLKWKRTSLKGEFVTWLQDIDATFPHIKNCIIASVSNLSDPQLAFVRQRFNPLVLTHQTKVPFTNKYTTPKTLGIDRIALVSAAAGHFPSENVLVIDAGTCITYDCLNHKKEYLGGAISPGLAMRYTALHTFTDKLPLLEAEQLNIFLGNSTATSIHAGVVSGVLYEIDGLIGEYRKKFHNLTVILTGGDLQFLRDSIKNDIFAHPNFLLEGLNHILEYNKLDV